MAGKSTLTWMLITQKDPSSVTAQKTDRNKRRTKESQVSEIMNRTGTEQAKMRTFLKTTAKNMQDDPDTGRRMADTTSRMSPKDGQQQVTRQEESGGNRPKL